MSLIVSKECTYGVFYIYMTLTWLLKRSLPLLNSYIKLHRYQLEAKVM